MENALIRVDLNATPSDRFALVQKLIITIEQIVCTTLGLLILSGDGKVYTIGYNDPEPVSFISLLSLLQRQLLQYVFLLFSRPYGSSSAFRLFPLLK